MGYKEVFEEDEVMRKVQGLLRKSSRSQWIMTLDYLLENLEDSVDNESMRDRLEVIYTKHNLQGNTTPVIPPSAQVYVYWGVGEPTPVTSSEVLALTKVALSGEQFTFVTGIIEKKYKVVCPEEYSITTAVDVTNYPVDVTSEWHQVGTVLVEIGGVFYPHSVYVMENAILPSQSHTQIITIN